MATIHKFDVEAVTCHAWNKDRTQVAISPNSAEVHIYRYVGNSWVKEHTLTEHTQRVTAIDWAPNNNRLVTCGVDRNSYVWNLKGGKWEPSLVVLRINRAATHVKWSPQENKFALGSGARLVSVCYFDEEHDWWLAKHIKKPIRSTVTCVDWHPDNILLACGSTDFKARVYSGYIKEIEKKPTATPWGAKMTFGCLMGEFSNGGGGWVHSVAFDSTGNRLAYVGHDSSLSVIDATAGQRITTVKTAYLPFTSVEWVAAASVIVAGHDYLPMLFTVGGDGAIKFAHKLDVPSASSGGSMSAMARFRGLDKRSTAEEEAKLQTRHQNAIFSLVLYKGGRGKCEKFSTSGTDGQIIIWDFKSLESAIQGLKIA